MKHMKHPNFILAIVSIIVLLIGIGMRFYGYAGGDYVIGFSALLGAIHYIWSIIDVVGGDLKGEKRIPWLIAVIACPVLGGMLYYVMHQTRGRIIT